MKIKLQDGILGLVLLTATVLLGFFVEQNEFYKVISSYSVFFIAYVIICFHKKNISSISFYILLSILLRFILIFAFPNLSNDIYRFIWDGRLLV
ncbi:MAG: mannosyltransferase, partial [Bacteroidota bacterium]